MPLHVAVDASSLMLEAKCGIKRYIASLLPALASADPEIDITAWMGFLRPVHGDGDPTWTVPNIRNRSLRVPRNWIERAWSTGLLGAEQLAGKAQLFHGLGKHLPPARRCRRVLTVFDCREVVFPELYPEKVQRSREVLTRSLDAADVIVAGSRATVADLRAHFDLKGRKIEVVYAGVDGFFRPQPESVVSGALQRLGLSRPYLLAIGSGDPRKNIPALVEAFVEHVKSSGDDLQLVVTGRRHSSYGAAAEMAENAGVADRIVFAGIVSDEDWRALLCGAEALVFPSLLEGFSLSPLEAMACGAPVLASRIPSIVEEVAEAALLFDPNDGGSIVGAIQALREDHLLRKRLIERGCERVRHFTWERIARDYAAIYRATLEN